MKSIGQNNLSKGLLLVFFLALSSTIVLVSCGKPGSEPAQQNDRVHAFYYNWYGNPEHEGRYIHWAHDILPHWSDTSWNDAGSFPGKNDIGANYFPALGAYSSNDSTLISKHVELMKQAGIGVFAITWWGKGSYEDQSISAYLASANRHGLKVAFHIEPFYKTAEDFRENLQYLNLRYGNHPALYRFKDKPFYYVYDSYKLTVDEWQKLLMPDGALTLRETALDATFIGLWVHEDDGDFFTRSGFNGFYTYFASDGFVYGSTSSNWQHLADFAGEKDLIFIPCVGPGYMDTRIRPWNSANTKSRAKGEYYEEMFGAALRADPDFIGITSFNEWHEGTQIEPAVAKTIFSYTYEDYGKDDDPLFYIHKTRDLSSRFQE